MNEVLHVLLSENSPITHYTIPINLSQMNTEKNPRPISVKPEGKGGLLSRSNPKEAYDCKLYRVIRLLDLKREGSG